MRDFTRFTSSDLAAVMNLLGEIQDLPPTRLVRAEHLLRGMAKIVGAQVGILSELHDYSLGKSLQITPLLDFGWAGPAERSWNMRFFEGEQLDDPLTNQIIGIAGKVVTRSRDELLSDRNWYSSPNVMELRRQAKIDHCIYSNRFSSPGDGMSIALHRVWGDRPFTDRDVAMVDIIHSCQRAYDLPQPQSPSLSPRQRQVLGALLSGDSEKQVAMKLQLSQHTVHSYIKAIYEEYDVRSRAELLSLWVQKPSNQNTAAQL